MLRYGYETILFPRLRTGASVAIWVHPELRVRMNVHVQLDTLPGSDAVQLSLEDLVLHGITGSKTLVVFCAGGSASAASLIPVVRPL